MRHFLWDNEREAREKKEKQEDEEYHTQEEQKRRWSQRSERRGEVPAAEEAAMAMACG